MCKCFAASQAYGLACEYEQNALPLRGCDECTGANEVCADAICDCKHPYYRVGDDCQEAADASHAVVAIAAVLASACALLL